MALMRELKGLDKQFNKLQAKHAKGFERGIKKACLMLQAASMELVPVDTGNLRATAFTRVTGSGLKTIGRVGYTAAYAIYVHEDVEALHGDAYNQAYADEIAAGTKSSRGPNQQAKFLETPARTKRKELIRIIQDEVKAST